NTLVLRTHINREHRFSELLKQVRQTALDAYSHQDIPFEHLVEQLNPSRSLSHSPLFQVMLALQNAPWEEPGLNGLKMSFPESGNKTAKFDLTLSVAEQDEKFVCDWEYNTDLFRPDTITRMIEHFRVLLEGILPNPEQLIFQLPLLTESEKHQLPAWNQTETDYPKDKTIVDLFREQVEKTPDNIALDFEGESLSYRELAGRANELAHHLATVGVGVETLVAVCLERSGDMVISLWGILKVGAAYVPLDPDYPGSRLQFMLEDSAAPVVLTQSHMLKRLPESTAEVVCTDSGTLSGSSIRPCPECRAMPDNIAYVLYTSGSTGMPKGVMVQHSSLFNHMMWMRDTFNFSVQDKIIQKTPFSFDASVWEFYAPLLTGGILSIAKPGGHKDPQYLAQMIQRYQVTVLQSVPSLLKMLLETQDFQTQIPLRYLFCGGEPLTDELKQDFYKHHRQTRLYNLYGPTEATIDTTSWYCDKNSSSVAIGRPIANTRIYILDTHHNSTPPGVPGELCIAGAGLARGYLNQPELTGEKFEVRSSNFELYHTGDLARWLPDGNIEFLGRIDHQVKLRGFRIELTEIETTLVRHKIVNEAVVVFNNRENNPRLIAYVTLVMPIDEVVGVLRDWLKARLPEYMAPAGFMVLEQLPLTPNGKLDRDALPQPGLSAHDFSIQAEHQAPRTETEHLLCNLWSLVLGMEVTGINSHFFKVGGHSLMATLLVSRIRGSFGIEVPLQMIFERPLLREQAQWLDSQQRGPELPPIVPLK
ncbi:MAG: amino acid adenylation domain-containing protein, partial [bacterium]|nr:amino acid adenylation domain-containing protein [bacterium]